MSLPGLLALHSNKFFYTHLLFSQELTTDKHGNQVKMASAETRYARWVKDYLAELRTGLGGWRA